MSHTVIGIFETAAAAQQAKQYLSTSGFSDAEIDVASNGTSVPDAAMGSNVASTTDTNVASTTDTNVASTTDTNFAATSDTNLTHKEEDLGDRIGNFFRNLFGGDNQDTQKYTSAGKRGTILTVHAKTSEEAQRAAAILDENGAIDVNESSTEYSGTQYGTSQATTTGVTGDKYSSLSDAPTDSIQIIEETIQVGKREVETGGVRLRSRIIERPVEESIRLRYERVNIDRIPVNRPATEADFSNFKEGEVELKERTEVPVVQKDARVVEEVSLGKEVTEQEKTISDTVRHTEVEAERIDPKSTSTSTNSSSTSSI